MFRRAIPLCGEGSVTAMEKGRIYLDWAATAPLCPEAAAAMLPFQTVEGNIAVNANANSLHMEGRTAFAAMEDARAQLARCVGARPDEIVFTSGATESDNEAIFGLALAARASRAQAGKPVEHPRIVTCSIEHDAVLNAALSLERFGFAVDVLPVDGGGFVSLDDVREALGPETVLVSIMMANNEVGSIQPVADIAKAAKACGALVHTDATQALGKLPVDFRGLGVDALSLSSHKIGGPKGVGALVLRSGAPFTPLMSGGGQEGGRRGGTQNVAGMVGFAAAARAVASDSNQVRRESARLMALRDKLYERLAAFLQVRPTVDCPAGSEGFLPNIVNVCVRGLESETLILRFDHLGVAVSGGSACSSHSLEPSRVLKALGIDRDTALCSLRFSLGRGTIEAEIDRALELFERVIAWQA